VKAKRQERRSDRSAWNEAAAAGLDMSLIELNLARSPRDRIRAHQRALATATALRAARERRQEGPHA
jgi:hypothetical protein